MWLVRLEGGLSNACTDSGFDGDRDSIRIGKLPLKMKSTYRIIAAVGGISMFLAGCATQPATVTASSTATTADWKIGEYSVAFRAGPATSQKSFSSYEVSRKFETLSYPSSIAIESAQSLDWFRYNPKSTPVEFVKLFTSSSGKTLLIVEEVPNDCGPCENWILIRGEDDSLIHDYLVLPSRLVKPDDVFEEAPAVTKVTEHEISFRYSDGKNRTMTVKELVKPDKRPTFPG